MGGVFSLLGQVRAAKGTDSAGRAAGAQAECWYLWHLVGALQSQLESLCACVFVFV